MNLTLTQVKNTLIAYANSKGRPEYSHYAVKAVYQAIVGGFDHPLKDLVIELNTTVITQTKKNDDVVEPFSKLACVRNNTAAKKKAIAEGIRVFMGMCSNCKSDTPFYLYRNNDAKCVYCNVQSMAGKSFEEVREHYRKALEAGDHESRKRKDANRLAAKVAYSKGLKFFTGECKRHGATQFYVSFPGYIHYYCVECSKLSKARNKKQEQAA